jgi:hypothetical protein
LDLRRLANLDAPFGPPSFAAWWPGANAGLLIAPAKFEHFFGHIRIVHRSQLSIAGEKELQRIDPSVLAGLYHTQEN